MSAYIDSGVLVKLYVRESNSPAAAAAVSAFSSVPFNPLQELEIRNTLRALKGRGLLTAAQLTSSEQILETDIQSRRLRRVVPNWTEAYRIAIKLSIDYTGETLARSLDVLHVAIAISEKAEIIITADARQEAVALLAGLKTRMIS